MAACKLVCLLAFAAATAVAEGDGSGDAGSSLMSALFSTQVSLSGLLYTVAGVLVVLVALQRRRARRWATKMAGPAGWPGVGQIPDMLTEPWMRFAQYAQKYGKVFRIYLWDDPMVVVSRPEQVKEMLKTKAGYFQKDSWSYNVFRGILGRGLVTSEGKLWQHQRNSIKPLFHHSFLARMVPMFMEATERMLSRWEEYADSPDRFLELDAQFRKLTLEIISEAALGLSPDEAGELPRLFSDVLDEMNKRVVMPWRPYLPLPANFRMHASLRRMDAMVDAISAARQKSGPRDADAPDLLDLLLSVGGMSQQQLRDEIKTMLLAGHETTSMMLCWTLLSMLRHPRVMAKARAEVDAVLGERTLGSADDYAAMKYLHATLREALRIFPPVPALMKEVVKPWLVDGVRIPVGTHVVIAVYGLHTDPDVWGEDVAEFKPERFEEGQKPPYTHPFAYLPFSLGRRDCIGQHFALLEAKVALARILQRFDLELMPDHPEIKFDSSTIPLRPADGVHVRVTRR